MNEMRKTKAIWTDTESGILQGEGIDIGYGGLGSETVMPGCIGFDKIDGDAAHISEYVDKKFDYVFSSHCLEHFPDPYGTLFEWWKLIRPGGYLFVIVPDEDLYEQGHWPSRFNPDHKSTFTISKHRSWSPKSVNVMDVCLDYERYKGAHFVGLKLQDHDYDRNVRNADQTTGRALAQIQFILQKRK